MIRFGPAGWDYKDWSGAGGGVRRCRGGAGARGAGRAGEAGPAGRGADQPTFKNSLEPSAIATAPIGYVRVHGRNFRDWFRAQAKRDDRYDYLYTAEELGPWAERVRSLAERPGTQDVYVVTNNHFRGQATANAVMLASMVESRRQEAPSELVARYRDALLPYVESPQAGTTGELF